jgi:alpha-L-rhamnosidase
MRTIIVDKPYRELEPAARWMERGRWPCSWISIPDAAARPLIAAYRCRFTLDKAETLRLHVTADERYELYVDGARIGRGPERGDDENWFFETYDVALAVGAHLLVARAWALGVHAPFAQKSARHGLLVATGGPRDALVGTGLAAWEGKRLGGYAFKGSELTWATGDNETVTASDCGWGFERGEGAGWGAVEKVETGANKPLYLDWDPAGTHLLRPAVLPQMRSEKAPAPVIRHLDAVPGDAETSLVLAAQDLVAERRSWQAWLAGGTVVIPPRTSRRAILDLGDYRCGYPALTASGGRGAKLRLFWAEGLYEAPADATSIWKYNKGHRDAVEGKLFRGAGDTFLPDGNPGRRFAPLWWRAGRYLELRVETAGEALTLDRFELEETGYPFAPTAEFAASDTRLAEAVPPMLRVMQMCMHETYMDCPYYEQMMYIGDTRLEVLTTYTLTADDRLPRKALQMFDASRGASTLGLTLSRWPVRHSQVIPPFSLWFLAMIHDFAQWRGDAAFVRSLMPGAHAVLDAFDKWMGKDGLLGPAPGWNFTDWTHEWRSWDPPGAPAAGMPPDADRAPSGILNWQLVYALQRMAELEDWLGEPERASRNRRRAAELAARVDAAFWDSGRGLYADDLAKTSFSEHAQCLSLLSGHLPASRRTQLRQGLLHDASLVRATVYFSHYLFEAYRTLDAMDAMLERLTLWFGFRAQGFHTTPESPEPSRSDCHAWSAHPLYHYHASILGVRPAGFGYDTVRIEPRLGPLAWARGATPHPRGKTETEFRRAGDKTSWRVVLPQGVNGVLVVNGREIQLKAGPQEGVC